MLLIQSVVLAATGAVPAPTQQSAGCGHQLGAVPDLAVESHHHQQAQECATSQQQIAGVPKLELLGIATQRAEPTSQPTVGHQNIASERSYQEYGSVAHKAAIPDRSSWQDR